MKRQIDPNKPKIKLPVGGKYIETKETVLKYGLHTICQSGNCPNLAECWQAGTATFMILGDICTRSCKFCSVATGKPLPPDHDEPIRVAESIKKMKLRHCVVTSVDRDDLPDGGAEHWNRTINAIKQLNPSITIEVLIPDFLGKYELIDRVIDAKPNIISHNLETIERLTPAVRSVAKYRRSLNVLEYIAKKGITAKSGIMLGLGETINEIEQTMDDLLHVGCKIITIGQYLQPTKENLPVLKFYSNEEFKQLETMAKLKGFDFVESGALVRSSYHAEKHV
ncbi:MAG TPA: lipoyl synthase [Bacteroidales bacterium]|nr:lipoyl synthase [Bacteroidales bacterium]